MWFIYALLSALGSACIAILVRLGLKNTPPVLLTVVFFAVQFVALLIFALATKKIGGSSLSSVTNKEWSYMVAIGIVSAIAYLSYLCALQLGTAHSVAAIDRTSILLVVILSVIVLGQPLTAKMIVGALMMIGGVILLTS